MNRRQFIKHNMQGALLLAAGGAILTPGDLMASTTPDIAVVKGAPGAATRAAVELIGGMSSVVKTGQRVVIKPNMSFASPPEWGATTHPEVIKALVSMCMEAGADDVRVLDHPLRSAELCLERSGIAAACAPLGSDMVQALETSSFFKRADIPDGAQMRENSFMADVLKADVLIAAPVAKSHGSTGVSLSMKGMMGLIWDRGVLHSRFDLSEAIVDLNTRLKADLVVIDATRVLSTNGPFGPGKVLTPDKVIASRDCVAADAYTVSAFEWWGRKMRPDQVKHIRVAHNRGLGSMDVDKLDVREVTV